jgi:hypothetical protein
MNLVDVDKLARELHEGPLAVDIGVEELIDI